MTASLDVCAIVISYNSRGDLDQLLDSVPAAMGDLEYQTIVVDNGSSDGSIELVEGRGDAALVRSENVGYAGGINKGAAASPLSDAYLILNPDTSLAPGCVPAMVKALQQPGVGIVAPKVINPDGTLELSLRRVPSVLRTVGLNRTGIPAFTLNLTDPEDYARGHEVDWAVGAVMLVSRECFEALGGWDDSFFLYAEETDFCLRARDRGYLTWYEPTAQAVHVGGGSGRNTKTETLRAMNSVRLYGRLHGRGATTVFWAVTTIRELFWGLRRRDLGVAVAMVRPSMRPAELDASDRLLPR